MMHQANAGFNTRLGFAGRTIGELALGTGAQIASSGNQVWGLRQSGAAVTVSPTGFPGAPPRPVERLGWRLRRGSSWTGAASEADGPAAVGARRGQPSCHLAQALRRDQAE